VFTQDADGRTPLHIAASVGNSELCYYLVTHGADINGLDSSGKSPSQVAKTVALGKLLQGDDEKAVEALAPWNHFEKTFKRPNQAASTQDFLVPICSVPVVFYALGSFPWYLSLPLCGTLMYVVGSALTPGGGKKMEAKPSFHAFYIGCMTPTPFDPDLDVTLTLTLGVY